MSFFVLRTKKINSEIHVIGSINHNYRINHPDNADKSKAHLNVFYPPSAEEVKRNFKACLPEKIRKNGVLLIEYVITASPSFFLDNSTEVVDAYFKAALDFLINKHGGENILSNARHRDETTEHAHIHVIPRVGGKFNCRHFLGGAANMRKLQDSFFADVACKFGLERGESSSKTKAKHQDVNKFYVQIESTKREMSELQSSNKNLLAEVSRLTAENEELRLFKVKTETIEAMRREYKSNRHKMDDRSLAKSLNSTMLSCSGISAKESDLIAALNGKVEFSKIVTEAVTSLYGNNVAQMAAVG
jgi:regulator of replication initiation timing